MDSSSSVFKGLGAIMRGPGREPKGPGLRQEFRPFKVVPVHLKSWPLVHHLSSMGHTGPGEGAVPPLPQVLAPQEHSQPHPGLKLRQLQGRDPYFLRLLWGLKISVCQVQRAVIK